MTTTWDHLAVFSFAVLLPAYVRYNYPRFQRALAAGEPGVRSRQYVKTLVRQWILALTAVASWLSAGRPLEALGLGRPGGTGFWMGVALAGLVVALWRGQLRAALRSEAARTRLVEQLEAVAPILPSDEHELRLFTALSITAGICEEILFRGYLIWYLENYVGILPAVVLAGTAFGLGHIYQGRTQALKIVVVGILFGGFYLGSGSLWVAMALHAALDASQGRLAHDLLRHKG